MEVEDWAEAKGWRFGQVRHGDGHRCKRWIAPQPGLIVMAMSDQIVSLEHAAVWWEEVKGWQSGQVRTGQEGCR